MHIPTLTIRSSSSIFDVSASAISLFCGIDRILKQNVDVSIKALRLRPEQKMEILSSEISYPCFLEIIPQA